jgi:antitoxin YefM
VSSVTSVSADSAEHVADEVVGNRRCRVARLLTRIMVMTETRPLADIKAHLSEIVDRVEDEHQRVILTRNGRPAAVLISPDDLEALEDTLELLADPRARREIERARRDIAGGKGIRADQIRDRYLRET